MKPLIKIAFVLIALLHSCLFIYAQDYPSREAYMKGKVLLGNTIIDTANATPGQMAFYRKKVRLYTLAKEHYYFNPMSKENIGVRFEAGSNSSIYEGLKQSNNGQDFTSILIDGKTSVEVIAQNIDSEPKAFNYLYRVIKNNNQELVGWAPPLKVMASADGSVKYAYLGKFSYTPGEFLKIEMYNVKNFSEQDAIFIDWRPVEPAKVSGYINYTSKHFPLPDNGSFSKNLTDLQQTTEKYFKYVNRKGVMAERPVHVKDFIETTSKNDIRFRADDSVQNLQFDIGNGRLTYNYKVSLKRNINGHTDSINLGENNSRINLYKEFWKNTGKYEIIFTPKIEKPGGNPVKLLRDKATGISFTVLPPLDQQYSLSLKTVAMIVLIILTTGGFMFFANRDRQKRKLAKAAQGRQIATLQLQAVRAQLNPHFIFNALAGIQNLMNKNEVENANKYLSKFARLTRNVLDNSDKELSSIEHETGLLHDYLLMEQMRFGFNFSIDVAPEGADQQIEIPAMLLQPFAENAVKHGVSALKDKGIIKIIITQTGDSLTLTVQDNGSGFSGNPNNGVGIKLCEERIKLLNSIYRSSTIILHKTAGSTGTLITIELKNWL